MKKAFRVIIPLLLVIAILFCAGWYLLVYDRAFTRDILLTAARQMENSGNHTASTWFYNYAYKQAGDNDAVAIELSNQYKASGNYTKAEYTLTTAIADGGGVDLYVALSKLYVEQDKLLDAVRMISNITNPEIKSQLEQMRPAAPTCTPDPAHYSQYITVEIHSQAESLYVNSDGIFPTIQTDFYDNQGITLHDGENTIYAIAVADNGLVSPVSIFAFSVGGVVKQIDFVDPTMETAFRETLNIGNTKAIYTSDLWTIQDFTVPEGVQKLDDLQHLLFLKTLKIDNGPSGQLYNIADLSNLEEVVITNTNIQPEEIPHLGKLESLKRLTLQNCGLSTITGLENAKGLIYLNLNDNSLRNILPISALSCLQELNLSNNALNDLLALSGLKNLSVLDVSKNELASLIPISTVSGLEKLNVANNMLTDLTGIAQLTNLVNLNVSYNQLKVVSLLASNTQLSVLNISDNQIVDITPLSTLNKLTNLNFANNKVTALPSWSESCTLININGTNNLIRSLEPLHGLLYLNNVYMNNNKDISNVEVLSKCPMLIQVDVHNTKVTLQTQVASLKEMGVLVNYDHKG